MSDLSNFSKEGNKKPLLKSAEFFLAGKKAQGGKGGRKTLLGDNIGGGVVTVRPLTFQCVGVWISNGLQCVYPHLCPYA
jgi:hypothetical protein